MIQHFHAEPFVAFSDADFTALRILFFLILEGQKISSFLYGEYEIFGYDFILYLVYLIINYPLIEGF